jgi:hypothetical protein
MLQCNGIGRIHIPTREVKSPRAPISVRDGAAYALVTVVGEEVAARNSKSHRRLFSCDGFLLIWWSDTKFVIGSYQQTHYMIEAKLKFRAFLLPWLTLMIAVLAYELATLELEPGESHSRPPELVVIFAIVMAIIMAGELRTRIWRMTIDGDRVVARNYFGFGPKREFDLTDFDGFKLLEQYSHGEFYEHLYLMKGDRKILKISDIYHGNYEELKQAIAVRLNCYGYSRFKWLDDYADYFRSLPKKIESRSNTPD